MYIKFKFYMKRKHEYNVVCHRMGGIGAGSVRMLAWNVPAEELIHIPQHWLKYPAPEPMEHYFLGFIYIFLMIMSLVGNGLVIWIFSAYV